MAKLILSDIDFNSVSRIRNLPAPAANDEPVRLQDLNSAVEGLAWKDSCRVAASSNINLASPGANVDGVAMSAGQRFLARGQTSQPENGIYIWNGAATPATRATDASTFDELEGAVTTIEEGTDAGASFRQTQVNGVIGTNNVIWASFGTGAPAASETVAGIAEIATQAETDTGTDDARFVTPLKLATSVYAKRKYDTTVGDGSATSYVVTHNLNTRLVHVAVYRDSGAYDEVVCEVEHTSVNTVTLRFAAAPSSNQFRVVVIA